MMATADQVEQADRKPKPPPRASWVTRKDSLLVNPAGADDATEQARTARTITRIALGRHDCPQLADETEHCGPEHDTDMADALTALRALGLTPDETPKHKRCPGCKTTKPLGDFPSDPRTPLGVHSVCRKCRQGERACRTARTAVMA